MKNYIRVSTFIFISLLSQVSLATTGWRLDKTSILNIQKIITHEENEILSGTIKKYNLHKNIPMISEIQSVELMNGDFVYEEDIKEVKKVVFKPLNVELLRKPLNIDFAEQPTSLELNLGGKLDLVNSGQSQIHDFDLESFGRVENEAQANFSASELFRQEVERFKIPNRFQEMIDQQNALRNFEQNLQLGPNPLLNNNGEEFLQLLNGNGGGGG
ncbi:MAG: hypothetical protein BM556_07525 [Bacteriovorax sp. MedPE-SWde]|nr:MAG: hypothetical protein BM556_07525 [Bacteriovorax sp. MedPE-SWde]